MTKKILIIEDETNLREALKDKFSMEGYQVIEARDGTEGVSLAKSMSPDIILLDIIMPKENGLDALKEIRNTASLIAVPVFMLTNLSEESSQKITSDLGANAYLVKSDIKIDDLIGKVKAILE